MPTLRITAALAAFAVLALLAASAFAQEEERTPQERALEEDRISLPAELGWVKFRITAGRIQAINTQYRESKTYATSNPLVGDTESLTMNVSPQATTLRYELKTAQEQLVVDFDSASSLTIERRPGVDGTSPPLSFTQPAEGNLRLTIGEGDARKTFAAPSFWHLMLLAPPQAREPLVEILVALRPGWQLKEGADGLVAALVQVADSGLLPDRKEWSHLIEQLGSTRFSERRTAERRLREAGPAVVAYLQTLPLGSMDAERRVRIQRLLESLSTTADDSPQRIAMWLIDDASIWLTVLASDDLHERQVAHQQLEKIAGMKLAFTPEAQAQVRAEQVEALKAKLRRR